MNFLSYRHIVRMVACISLVSALGTAGCSQSIDIYFRDNEQWEIVSEFAYDPEALLGMVDLLAQLMLEEQLPVDPQLFMSESEEVIDAALDQLTILYEQQGISMEWNRLPRVGERAYRLVLRGTGYDRLESVLPPGSTIIHDEKTNTLDISIYFGELIPWSRLLFEQEITLHAARILEANTPYVERQRATWHNPSSIEVTLVPQTKPDLRLLILVVGLLCAMGLIVGGFALSRRRKRHQMEFTERW